MDQVKASHAARAALICINMRILDATSLRDVPNWCCHSKPYLRAIADNDYGLEDPVMCVLYALDNLTSWRGDEAKDIKKRLKESIK